MRLIDAEEVIKAVDKHTFETKDGLCLDDDISIILEDVPTIEERKWIPCSERLPENDTRVLVTFATGEVGMSSWHDSTEYNHGFDCYQTAFLKDGRTKTFGVVAWMPLPEPYKEVGT